MRTGKLAYVHLSLGPLRQLHLREGSVVLGAAVLLFAAFAYVLRNTRGYLFFTDGRLAGDITDYIYWTRLVTLGGVQNAYGGTWPETYAVYPPVPLYVYQVVGWTYRSLVDPSFQLEAAITSMWLVQAVRLVAIGWHLLTATAIYILTRRVASERTAGLAAALYAANPAAIANTAYWGQPDGAHSLFSVLAVGFLASGRWRFSWAAMSLGALAKPQAWALLPLLVLATWRQHGRRRLVEGVGIGGSVAIVVVLPFILSGRVTELLSLPAVISSVAPLVTAGAQNVWYLYPAGRFAFDSAQLFGPLSYRTGAALLVASQMLVVFWLYHTGRVKLAEAAALMVLGWFVFTTQAHENHLFLALPLLALAWPERPSLIVFFAIISATVFINIVSQDPILLQSLGLTAPGGNAKYGLRVLQLGNAVMNVLCLASWIVTAARRHPENGSRLPQFA